MFIKDGQCYQSRCNNVMTVIEFTQGIGDYYNVTAKAYYTENPTFPVTMFLELRYKLNAHENISIYLIKIIDLIGNGDNNNKNCNKGIGSSLVSSTLYLIESLFKNNREQEVRLTGTLSNVGDNTNESHNRRVYFWQKHGLAVQKPSDPYSKLSGKLEAIKTSLTHPIIFNKINVNILNSTYNDYINILTWEKSDDLALDALINTVPHSVITIYKQIDIIEIKATEKWALWDKKSNFMKIVTILYEKITPPKPCHLSYKKKKLHDKLNPLHEQIEQLIYNIDSSNFNLLFRAINGKKLNLPKSLYSLLDDGKISRHWLMSTNSKDFIVYLYNTKNKHETSLRER